MDFKGAETNADLHACYPVMAELRPHLSEEAFVAQVGRQRRDGYRVVFLELDGKVVAVAGYRISENLAWGRFMYVDDLVTERDARSHGHGAKLLAWLEETAREQGCTMLHLDSNVLRTDAHRFYLRHGMIHRSHHFSKRLDDQGAP